MFCRILSNVFLLAGVGFLALAAYDYFSAPPGPQLEVEQADIEIADLTPGKQVPVVFHLANHSGRPMRVLGQSTC